MFMNMDVFCVKYYCILVLYLLARVSYGNIRISFQNVPTRGSFINCTVPSTYDTAIVIIKRDGEVMCSMLVSTCPRPVLQHFPCGCFIDEDQYRNIFYITDANKAGGLWTCQEFDNAKSAVSIVVKDDSLVAKKEDPNPLPPLSNTTNVTIAQTLPTIQRPVTVLQSNTTLQTSTIRPTTIVQTTTLRPNITVQTTTTLRPNTTLRIATRNRPELVLPTTTTTVSTTTTTVLTTTTRPTRTTTMLASSSGPIGEQSTNNTGLVVGVVTGVILLIMVIIVIAVLVILYFNRVKTQGTIITPHNPVYVNNEWNPQGSTVMSGDFPSGQHVPFSPVYANTANPMTSSSIYQNDDVSSSSNTYQNFTRPLASSSSFGHHPPLAEKQSNTYEQLNQKPEGSIYEKLNSGNGPGKLSVDQRSIDRQSDPSSNLSPIYVNTSNTSPLAKRRDFNGDNPPSYLEVVGEDVHRTKVDSGPADHEMSDEPVSLEYMNYTGKK